MHAVPIRGPDGKIVDFVDPHAPQEPEAEAADVEPGVEVPEEDAEPAPRRSQSLRPGERKPLGDLFGAFAPSQHPNRSFTTGMAAGLLGALIVAGLILASRAPASAPATLPTSARATVSAPTSAPTAPVVAIAPPTVGRALVAYAAPDGTVVGAMSADRAISLTGTFGSDWVQIHTPDSGSVWVKKVDLPSAVLDPAALARLPDLAPPPTATALPSPTVAPVARSVAPAAPVSAPIAPAAPARSNASGCTPDRVVAIVTRGAMQIASCLSLADAQSSLPNSTVVAASADEAQAFYARVAAQATAFAQP